MFFVRFLLSLPHSQTHETNMLDFIKKLPLIETLRRFLGNGRTRELIETAKDKLQEGPIEVLLNKVGIDSEKIEDLAEMATGALDMAEKVLGDGDEEVEEDVEEEFEEDTEEES